MAIFFYLTALLRESPRTTIARATGRHNGPRDTVTNPKCIAVPEARILAYGNNLAATVVLSAALVWHILRPPVQDAGALPPAAGQAKT